MFERSRICIQAHVTVFFVGLAAWQCAHADTYPARPVKLVVQAAPGNAGDIAARIVAQPLAKALGQPVVVENRAGAGGIVAAQAITQAPADGHTLFFAAASALVIAPHVQASLPYDPLLDFAPIAFVAEIPLVIGVAPAVEAPTLAALISRASAHPSRVEYAANSPGTFPHLATELLASHANVQFTYVPYKGVAQALPDLAGGRISMVVEGLAGLSGAIKARQVQPLAVTSSARLPNFPDLPTVSETVRDYRAIGWFAVLTRRGTAEPILARLHEELARVLGSKEVESALHGLSSYPRPMSREALTAFIHEEHKLWGDVVKRIGFKPK